MNKPLKIAIYSGAVPSSTFIERLINGLAKSGNSIFIYGYQNSKQSAKNNIHYYTYSNRLSKIIQLIKYSILLKIFKPKDKRRLDNFIINKNKNTRLLKVKFYPVLYHEPDIFHIQWAKSLEDWIWVKMFGIKLILSLRGTHITISPIGNPSLAKMYSELFPQVDGFHSVSNATSKIAQKYGAEARKINTIYSGLPLDDLKCIPKINDGKVFKILSVGRAHWTKGYAMALDAMALLKNNGIKFQYIIVGVGTNEELLFQRNQLDLENEVTFLDVISFDEVVKIQRASNVLLLSSIEEGIANVVLEAMALGTLVVSTNCGGMSEVIEDGINGFMTPLRNPKEMAVILEKVSKLLIEEQRHFTKMARLTIEKQHDEKKMISEIQMLYKNVLNHAL